MSDVAGDVYDHFTEVFGNKRGATRPDGEPSSAQEGIPCAGGCGRYLAPDDPEVKRQLGHCDQCSDVRVAVEVNLRGVADRPIPSAPFTSMAKKAMAEHVAWHDMAGSQANFPNGMMSEMPIPGRKGWTSRQFKCFFTRPFGHLWVSKKMYGRPLYMCNCLSCGKWEQKSGPA